MLNWTNGFFVLLQFWIPFYIFFVETFGSLVENTVI